MNLNNIFLTTLIPELPRILRNNFNAIQDYFNLFYDGSSGKITSPVNTTGRVKAATGEFVTTITDDLIVKNQWTNLYENTTTVDLDFYYAYDGSAATTRDASTWENSEFSYIDINKPYYKISNDVSTAFKAESLGQEIQLLFDLEYTSTEAPFTVLYNPSIGGGYQVLNVTYADASAAWIKLIAVDYDASWGTTWFIKQYGGTYTLEIV